MPNYHPAYRAGESVFFKSYQELLSLYESSYREGKKWIHDILADDWTKHAGMQVRIKESSIYHNGWILYEFQEVEGYWLEDTIVDLSLAVKGEDQCSGSAFEHYEVRCHLSDGDSGVVQIVDRKSNEIYCFFRKNNASLERLNIEKVSKLRDKECFEDLYGFDGFYEALKIAERIDHVGPIIIDRVSEYQKSIMVTYFDSNEDLYSVTLERSIDYVNTEHYNQLFLENRKACLNKLEEQKLGASIMEFMQTYADEIDDFEFRALNEVINTIRIPSSDRSRNDK